MLMVGLGGSREDKMAEDRAREMKLRNWARRLGISMHKSRSKHLNQDPNQRYMLKDTNQDQVIKGEKYELTLNDVEKFLKDYEANIKVAR